MCVTIFKIFRPITRNTIFLAQGELLSNVRRQLCVVNNCFKDISS